MKNPFPAYRGSDPYIFVCYSHHDADIVYPEIAQLHARGINVWYDEGISPGTNWRAEIGEAIEQAERVLIYISQASLGSAHCNREINYALDQNKLIIPVRLDNTSLTADLRLGLSRVQAINRSEHKTEAYRDMLYAALGAAPVKVSTSDTVIPKNKKLLVAGITATLIAIFLTVILVSYDPLSTQEELQKTIVVLPFVNLSDDVEQEYFSRGVSEEILKLLARTTSLKVISRTSAFSYQGENPDVATYVEDLGITHLLEGSVRKGGDQIRITVQLIDAIADTNLWANTYTRKLDDVFAIQDEIAAEVALQLKARLLDRPKLAYITDPETHRLFLQGRHLLFQFTQDSLQAALSLLQKAVAQDPAYYPALKELSRAYMNSGQWELALETAEKAIELEPNNTAALAWIEMRYHHDMAAAAHLQEQALRYDPTDIDILRGGMRIVLNLRRPNDAIRLGEYLVEHDPLCMTCLENLGEAYVAAGLLEEAETTFQQLLDLGQGRVGGYPSLAIVKLLKGDGKEAMSLYEQAGNPVTRDRGILLSLYLLGREDEYNAKLVQFQSRWGSEQPLHLATVYAWTGEIDEAFVWMNRYIAQGNLSAGVYMDPLFENLHNESRWQTFLESFGVSDVQLAKIDFKPSFPR